MARKNPRDRKRGSKTNTPQPVSEKKTGRPSRKQQFNRDSRNSWIRFLTKIALFVVPIVGITAWMIVRLLSSGNSLPILTLDYEAGTAEQRSFGEVWHRQNFALASDTKFKLQKPQRFGGPNRDSLIIFCDVLGDARMVDGQLEPCIFVPNKKEEYQTYAYEGLLGNETPVEASQWEAVDKFIANIVNGITPASSSSSRRKIIFALDVDHPDLPGRLPPQSNQFIDLCQKRWSTKWKSVQEKYDVFVWLSHSRGQKSYLDSAPDQVESFFKRRFELAITGDVLNADRQKSSGGTVYYSDLKRYLERWVKSDSDVHRLAQTPTFLQPASFGDDTDFEVIEFFRKPEKTEENGKLFAYPVREFESELDQWWTKKEFCETNYWDVENPLLMQRSTMLLLQMERLWYTGLRDTSLYDGLEERLASMLDTANRSILVEPTIAPFRHTLYEAFEEGIEEARKEAELKDLTSAFDLAWVSKVVPGLALEDTEAKKEMQRRKDVRAEWSGQYSDWRGGMAVWLALRDSNAFDLLQIEEAVEIMSAQQRVPLRTETSDQDQQIESLVDIDWNEIAYLKRLRDELTWPTEKESREKFRIQVQNSVIARDHANRFAAQLLPVLSPKFAARFLRLETKRRFIEDRIFAGEIGPQMATDQTMLLDSLKDLDADHLQLANQFRKIQRELVFAPHDLRYALESLSPQSQNRAEDAARMAAVGGFEEWLADANAGFDDAWIQLGSQMIGALMDDPTAKVTDRMEVLQRAVFADAATEISNNEQNAKRLATNAYLDYQWLSRKLIESKQGESFIGVAEGNLLARRLLGWPGMSVAQRKQIREGLSDPDPKNRVKPSGETEPSTVDFAKKEIADRLQSIYAGEGLEKLLPRNNPIEYNIDGQVNGDENYFIRLAAGAHRLVQQDDATLQNTAVAINDFRSRKSDLQFRRVAGDLWGTKAERTPTAYALAALRNHQNIINDRVKTFRQSTVTDAVKGVWNDGPKQNWPNQIQDVEDFCSEFQGFRWVQADQQVSNRALAEVRGPDFEQMMFALYPKKKFEVTRPSKFEPTRAAIDAGVFEAQNNKMLNVFLRGHQKVLAVSARPKDRSAIGFDVEPEMGRFPGSEISVVREELGPIAGHVTLVLDCSKSMGTGEETNDGNTVTRMDMVQQDVVGFLEDMSKRGDIAVSLVAIGASELWRRQNELVGTARSADELSSWRQIANTDVWVYRQSGKRVTQTNLTSLTKAVRRELEPKGDTPILSGLDVALDLAEGQQQNLVVLLTDGFEFKNRKRKPNELIAPFENEVYESVDLKIQKNDDIEVVVFSYLPSSKDEDLRREFKNQIDQGVPLQTIRERVKRIEALADPAKVRYRKAKENSALKKFFDELLPKPFIQASDQEKQLFREMIQYEAAQDKPILDKQIGLDQLSGGRWRIEVEFTSPKIAANGFAQKPAPWSTPTPLVGNEKLQFVYEPFRPSLGLTSGKLRGDAVDFGGTGITIRGASERKKEPQFQIVASDADTLTPAPELAVVAFQASKDKQQIVLLQDFALKQQVSSNVHPIAFPVFDDEHRRAAFFGQSIDMKLIMLRTISPQLWSKVSFGEDAKLVVSANSKNVTLPAGDFGPIEELLPNNKLFDGYSFQLRRLNEGTDFADFTLKIESRDKPVDRWIVNVVDEDGQIDRYATKQKKRTHWYKENFDGSQKLIRIEHQFHINKERLRESKLFFGITHLDELSGATTIDYPEYFAD